MPADFKTLFGVDGFDASSIKIDEPSPWEGETRLVPVVSEDIRPRLTPNGTLLEGVLDAGASSTLYGDSNAGKTFVAVDIGFHIALSLDWNGHRVLTPGPVAYFALEGGNGIDNRITAWRKHHGIQDDVHVPFYVIKGTVDLIASPRDVALMTERIKQIGDIEGHPVAWTVVDTLARAFGGGDENSSQHMGTYVRNTDKIREATGTHLTSIHHSGKDRTKEARGHSSLRAAVDTEIRVTRDEGGGTATVAVLKQRDMPIGDTHVFKLHPVELGSNQNGETVTSAVPVYTGQKAADDRPASTKKPKLPVLTPDQSFGLDILVDVSMREGEAEEGNLADAVPRRAITMERYFDECEAKGLSKAGSEKARRRTYRSILAALEESGYAATYLGKVRPTMQTAGMIRYSNVVRPGHLPDKLK